MEVPLKIKRLHPDVVLPSYGRPGDAGLDLVSREDKLMQPGERHVFKLGFAMAIPEGCVALVWDRSGMAAKHGMKSMAGVVDHTYRGEMGVVLVNLSGGPYEVKRGDRIAQMLIQPIHTAQVEAVEELPDSVRGDGAYGSSGR